MDEKCEYCLANEWTRPAYNERCLLQIGCWRCYSVYFILDAGPVITKQNPRNPIFWKDLQIQWNEALDQF
jgi:hypothetical protein